MLMLNACVHTLSANTAPSIGVGLHMFTGDAAGAQIAARKESSLACLTAHHCFTSFFTLIRAFLHCKPEQTLLAGNVAC